MNLKEWYAKSPVVAHAIISILVILINLVFDKAGLPNIDDAWLIGILGLANVPANYKTVTPAVGHKDT